jgi:hypothetical protein
MVKVFIYRGLWRSKVYRKRVRQEQFSGFWKVGTAFEARPFDRLRVTDPERGQGWNSCRDVVSWAA